MGIVGNIKVYIVRRVRVKNYSGSPFRYGNGVPKMASSRPARLHPEPITTLNEIPSRVGRVHNNTEMTGPVKSVNKAPFFALFLTPTDHSFLEVFSSVNYIYVAAITPQTESQHYATPSSIQSARNGNGEATRRGRIHRPQHSRFFDE